jgi:hypothetical protein
VVLAGFAGLLWVVYHRHVVNWAYSVFFIDTHQQLAASEQHPRSPGAGARLFLVALAGLSLVFTAVGAWVFLVALAGFSLVSVRAFAGLLLLVTLLTPFLARRFRPGGARDALPVARIGNPTTVSDNWQPHSVTAHVDTQSNRTTNISNMAGVLCVGMGQLKMSADSIYALSV